MFNLMHEPLDMSPSRSARARLRVAAACCLIALPGLAGATSPASSNPQSARPLAAVDAAAREEVVEALAQKLQDDYAHADLGARMAMAIRTRLAAGEYDRINTAEELARSLQADVRAIVNDKHLRVSFDPRPGPGLGPMPGKASRPGPEPMPPPGMMPELRKENGAIRKIQILAGNVGYMAVNGMLPMANDAIDAAFAFLRNTDALIIDLRGNGGGSPETVAYYMSYLSEGEPVPVMRIHTRHEGIRETRTTNLGGRTYGNKKPVFVLTSYMTFSGGEELAYDVQATKRGLVVGELTGGGANPGTVQPLGRGFVVFLPFGYVVHPTTGTAWEGVGVKPDVAVAASVAPAEAHRLAVTSLRERATDPMERARLDALIEHLARKVKSGATPTPQGLSAAQRQLLGTYVPLGGVGPSSTISEKDGYLVLQPNGSKPSSRLVPAGNGTYQLEGLPDGFIATFTSAQNGKVLLSLYGASPPSPVMEKQGS